MIQWPSHWPRTRNSTSAQTMARQQNHFTSFLNLDGFAHLCFISQNHSHDPPSPPIFRGHLITNIGSPKSYGLLGTPLPGHIHPVSRPPHLCCLEPSLYYKVIVKNYDSDTQHHFEFVRRLGGGENDAGGLTTEECEDENEGQKLTFVTSKLKGGVEAKRHCEKYFPEVVAAYRRGEEENGETESKEFDAVVCLGRMNVRIGVDVGTKGRTEVNGIASSEDPFEF